MSFQSTGSRRGQLTPQTTKTQPFLSTVFTCETGKLLESLPAVGLVGSPAVRGGSEGCSLLDLSYVIHSRALTPPPHPFYSIPLAVDREGHAVNRHSRTRLRLGSNAGRKKKKAGNEPKSFYAFNEKRNSVLVIAMFTCSPSCTTSQTSRRATRPVVLSSPKTALFVAPASSFLQGHRPGWPRSRPGHGERCRRQSWQCRAVCGSEPLRSCFPVDDGHRSCCCCCCCC